MPWAALCVVIEPFYPKARTEGGHRPVGLERMLPIDFLQQWHALSDWRSNVVCRSSLERKSVVAKTSRIRSLNRRHPLFRHDHAVGLRVLRPDQTGLDTQQRALA